MHSSKHLPLGGETTGTGGATWGAGPTSWDTVGTAGTWSSAPQPAPRETDSGHVQRMNDNVCMMLLDTTFYMHVQGKMTIC